MCNRYDDLDVKHNKLTIYRACEWGLGPGIPRKKLLETVGPSEKTLPVGKNTAKSHPICFCHVNLSLTCMCYTLG